MARGVVLGWASPLDELLDRAGVAADELTVVVADAATVERLRDRGVDAVDRDPLTAGAVLEDASPAVVVVGDPDPQQALRLITRARAWFPDARVLAYGGPGTTTTERERLRAAADHLVDHAELSADAVLQAASSAAAVRAFRVRRVIDDIDGDVCVFTHDNPDPDAIASAVAVVRLVEHLDATATARFHGEITHQSNRAFVNALDLPLVQHDRDEPPAECDGIVLVDHSIPGRNDSLATETRVDLVFDHHRPTGPVDGRYVDIRESVGATSAILVEYLEQFDVPIDETLATALLYGISTDTQNFTRAVAPLDFNAAASVWGTANHDLIERIDDPGVSQRTLQTIADAISHREVRGPVLAAFAGASPEKDALAQAADLLVQMDTVSIVLVYGLDEGVVYASARARGAPSGFDLSMVIRDAFAQIGSAGGHEEMAGAQIPLGFLGAEVGDDDAALSRIVREVIEERFFDAVANALGRDATAGWSAPSGEPGDVFGHARE